jgi:hypothetical protein
MNKIVFCGLWIMQKGVKYKKQRAKPKTGGNADAKNSEFLSINK